MTADRIRLAATMVDAYATAVMGALSSEHQGRVHDLADELRQLAADQENPPAEPGTA